MTLVLVRGNLFFELACPNASPPLIVLLARNKKKVNFDTPVGC
jgi:hypothetical protein